MTRSASGPTASGPTASGPSLALGESLSSRLRAWVGRLPDPGGNVLRAAYRSVSGRTGPVPVPLRYPTDVADAEALRSRLRETDVFGEARLEAEGYLTDALERIRVTMALIPPLPPDATVLELGANPYFITRLLRDRGVAVTCANWFGAAHGVRPGPQIVTESGVTHAYEFDHFNVEEDVFPYADDSFDLVLFCEILEHLPFDPVNALCEIHRVLRRSGTMLLTTPNAIRLENLTRMMRGDNVYEELSGYGAYGRHNREYTVGELRALLDSCGYDPVDVFARDIGRQLPHAPVTRGIVLDDRGENLFALARPTGEPRWRYPPWLYSSRHALTRIVRPDVRMGYNDELQARGFHPLEEHGDVPFRWTGGQAVVLLRVPAGGGRLRIEGQAPPPIAGASIELRAAIDGAECSWDVPCHGGSFVVEANVALTGGDGTLELQTNRTWRPGDVGLSTDARSLGVAVSRVAIM